MNKYSSLFDNIYSLFGRTQWTSNGISTIPENFSGHNVGNEFIRISVIASDISSSNPLISAKGQVIIDIFVPTGTGTKRGAAIADLIDSLIAGKTVSLTQGGNVQFGASSLTPFGIDKANTSLARFSYSISFNYFGN